MIGTDNVMSRMCVAQEFEGMLEESRDIKLGFRYGQARTLFEDDSRWKVSYNSANFPCSFCISCLHKIDCVDLVEGCICMAYQDPLFYGTIMLGSMSLMTQHMPFWSRQSSLLCSVAGQKQQDWWHNLEAIDLHEHTQLPDGANCSRFSHFMLTRSYCPHVLSIGIMQRTTS